MRNVPLTPSFSLLLSPGETPASGAKSLSTGARTALVACATAGRLIGTRQGWHTPAHPKPITKRTVASLCERGLLSVRRLGATRDARLTSTGKWYARTLCSAIAGDVFTSEGVETCATEN